MFLKLLLAVRSPLATTLCVAVQAFELARPARALLILTLSCAFCRAHRTWRDLGGDLAGARGAGADGMHGLRVSDGARPHASAKAAPPSTPCPRWSVSGRPPRTGVRWGHLSWAATSWSPSRRTTSWAQAASTSRAMEASSTRAQVAARRGGMRAAATSCTAHAEGAPERHTLGRHRSVWVARCA